LKGVEGLFEGALADAGFGVDSGGGPVVANGPAAV